MQYKTLIALDAIQIERSIQPEKRFENIVIRRNIKGTTTLGLNLHIQYTRRHTQYTQRMRTNETCRMMAMGSICVLQSLLACWCRRMFATCLHFRFHCCVRRMLDWHRTIQVPATYNNFSTLSSVTIRTAI